MERDVHRCDFDLFNPSGIFGREGTFFGRV